jgi:hypothetical protein
LSNPDEIVGHKTFSTGDPLHPFRHEPLTRADADEIWKRVEEAKAKREADMPTERDALRVMVDAYHRLHELGWNNAIYCPKDGTRFLAIEPGSSGIHDCHYRGEWPDGSWWIESDGDLWPSRPCLWKEKLYPPDDADVAPAAVTADKEDQR